MDIISTILTLVKGGISLANKLADRAETNRKIQNGIDKQVKAYLEVANAEVSNAINARRDARRKFDRDGMPKDYRYFRD